jgi:hypothetical protein
MAVGMDVSKPANRLLLQNALARGVIAVAHAKPEFAMQPFGPTHPPDLFSPWSADCLEVVLYMDKHSASINGLGLTEHLGHPITTARISLNGSVFTDFSYISQDAALTVGVSPSGDGLPKADEQSTSILADEITRSLPPKPILLSQSATETLHGANMDIKIATKVLSRFLIREPADGFSRSSAIHEG